MVAVSVCVPGVALGDIGLRFAWQAWHLVTSILTLRGRRGTYGTGLALLVVVQLLPLCPTLLLDPFLLKLFKTPYKIL